MIKGEILTVSQNPKHDFSFRPGQDNGLSSSLSNQIINPNPRKQIPRTLRISSKLLDKKD
jgi:hypothetical protein